MFNLLQITEYKIQNFLVETVANRAYPPIEPEHDQELRNYILVAFQNNPLITTRELQNQIKTSELYHMNDLDVRLHKLIENTRKRFKSQLIQGLVHQP